MCQQEIQIVELERHSVPMCNRQLSVCLSADDCCQVITLDIQLGAARYGRFGVRQRRALHQFQQIYLFHYSRLANCRKLFVAISAFCELN